MKLQYLKEDNLEKRIKYLHSHTPNFWSFYLSSYFSSVLKLNDFKKFFDEKKIEIESINNSEKIEIIANEFKVRMPSKILYWNLTQKGIKENLWASYYRNELKEAKLLASKSPEINNYLELLNKNYKRANAILFFLNNTRYRNGVIEFHKYAIPKLGEDFIDLKSYENKFHKLFTNLDSWYYSQLVIGDNPIETSEVTKILQQSFDLIELASPIIFIEYPNELVVYKKLIKNWLLIEVEKRKRQFMWEEGYIPMPYLEITKFANRLLDPAERDYLIKDSPEYFQYPKHIFSGFKGYKLFEYYSKGIYNQTMLTFIYRNMRSNEREEYKILADPAPFLEWYNSQREHDNIFQINQPLSKVNSKERQQNYKIIKSLIEELYPTT